MKNLLLFVVALAFPASALAQSETFVLRIGKDTIALETFVRSATRLEGDLSGPTLPNRLRYSVDFAANSQWVMQFEVIPKGADTPSVRGHLTLRGDTVYAILTRAGAKQPEQRFASQRIALPFANPSFALTELITTRAQRVPGDSAVAPIFVVESGATMPTKVKWFASDSARFSLGGVDLNLQLDARGRIMRASVPMQNLTVERVAGTLNRSMNTRPDYSAPAGAAYTAEDVKVPTTEGHALGATLTMPRTRSGRIPAVITISGSGAQDRDEAIAGMRGYRPFREVAEALAARGVAVLRYDDRGFGESGGVYGTATTADFANDTRAVISYLRARPEIDPDRIFLVGHSEGGMVAPMVAAEDKRLRGIVLLAGPAYTGRKIMEYQSLYAINQRSEKSAVERDSLYRANLVEIDSAAARQPWVRFFSDYDPVPTLRKVKAPVLVIHGATDRQVTADQAEIIGKTLRAAGNTDVAVHVLPDVNHLFLSDPVGNASGYSALPSRTVVPQMLQLLGDWIATKSK